MASLTIVRDSGYADRLRAYTIVLDDEKIGEVKDGETKRFSLAPGNHRLALRIDWGGSKTVEFTVTEADHLTFQAKSNLRGPRVILSLWYVLFEPNSYLLVEQISSSASKQVA